MYRRKKWMVSLVLSLSVLCGTLPVSAVDTQEIVVEQEVAAVKPAAPQNVTATALATGGIQISWETAENATGYRVYRMEEGSWKLLHIVRGGSETSYTDLTTKMNTTYTYTVRTYNCGSRETLLSDYDAVGVSATTATALAEPKLGSAVSGGYNRIIVTWDAVGCAQGYEIFRRSSASEDWMQLGSVKGLDTTSYIDTGVTCGTTYYYIVRAYGDIDGTPVYSTCSATGISGKAIPAAPTVSASASGSGSIKLSWSAVDGASGYHIYRKTSSSDAWTYVNSVPAGNTGYTDSGLTTGKTYYYTVAAYRTLSNGSQCIGTYGNSVSATPLLAAPALNSVTMGNKGLIVKWSAVSGAGSYRIYRKTTGTSWAEIASVGSGTTSYEDTKSLTDGTKYTYTVAGCTSSAVGAYNTTGISGTYYSYQAALNSGTLPSNIALPNVKKEQFGTSAEGRALCAYTVGTGSKHMVLNFAIHGWEDHWSRDGYELVRVACKVLEKLSANASTVTSRGWSVTVIPYANPDGIVSGYSHNGPGRCSTYRYNNSGTLVKGGVDMNRCFPSGFTVYTNARNYTGSQPLMTKESRALKTLVDNKKGSSTNVFIDIHGWTQQILTNTSGSGFVYSTLHSYFPSNSAGGLGGGYISRYAKSVGYSACLFEFPRSVTSHSTMVNAGYDTKFVNAVMSMVNNY
ncbi:MAG: fibronectin type III domain-containing protein [Clostridia bacterium]|nr:fibronectin type III domain-containing protein [Clostridia bacterium]